MKIKWLGTEVVTKGISSLKKSPKPAGKFHQLTLLGDSGRKLCMPEISLIFVRIKEEKMGFVMSNKATLKFSWPELKSKA